MGWCHTAAAGKTLSRIEAACRKSREGTQETSSNVFVQGGKAYFFEVTRRDQKDGGISGTIHVCIGSTHARQTATFRIAGNGEVVRGPKLFKNAQSAIFSCG